MMKLIKIKHYVEKSYQNKPSFVLEMSDGKNYISNGCVFSANTQENINKLIQKYDVENMLDELFASPEIKMSNVKNASYMFKNCKRLTVFRADMSNVTDARSMFYGCNNLAEFNADMSNVKNANCIFHDCTNLAKFNTDISSMIDASWMFSGCTNLAEFNADMPSVINTSYMFYGCTNLKNNNV